MQNDLNLVPFDSDPNFLNLFSICVKYFHRKGRREKQKAVVGKQQT